jgi:hypothetical protein
MNEGVRFEPTTFWICGDAGQLATVVGGVDDAVCVIAVLPDGPVTAHAHRERIPALDETACLLNGSYGRQE